MSVLLSWGHISFKGETELYDTLRFFLQALSEPWLYVAKRQRKADQTEEGALFYMTIGLHLVACKDELWEEKKPKNQKPCILKKSGNGGEWSWYRPLLLSGCFPREPSQRAWSLYIGAGAPDCLYAGCSALTSRNRNSCWGNACFYLSKQCILTWLERFLECCWIDNFELLPVLESSRVLLF